MRLQNKNIVVTGGTSGIGQSTALKLVSHGANVVIAGRNEDRGNTILENMKGSGSHCAFFKCDVTQKNEVNDLIDFSINHLGSIDCLFNNAGIEGEIANFAESSEVNWDQVIDTNLKGTWHCMKAVIPHMLSNGQGNIINMSSTSGLVGNGFGMTAYAASKFAIIGLTKSVALEYAKQNIRVNAICPAFVETPMTDEICEQNPKYRRRFEMCQPIGRMAQPDEIADAVVYLCSDESRFMTGTSFIIDGGLTI